MSRRILVTSALPYANGQIHLGHLVEYIQTDIWVRFQKLRGNRCIYICADDTHGTAIMIRARQEGRSEEALIADMREAHLRDFTGFDVQFDNYGSTHSEQNRQICGEFWAKIRAAGLVQERDVTQLYDPTAQTFLADRFVKGTCPICGAADQYGDNCDKCASTYSPTELINPVSTLSGSTPELRTAEHLLINIEASREFLDEWTQTGDRLQPEVANSLNGQFLAGRTDFKDYSQRRDKPLEWEKYRTENPPDLSQPENEWLWKPLRDWDVSRPAPYFGFEIPDSPGDYWYVWFDAPIGYCGSTLEWCQKNNENFDDWWKGNKSEVHHFIGKDITYFHTLFWPAMLKTAGFNLPKKVHIHGFLTVNGEKMSKTKGTFIQASTYLKHLDPQYLRYYYASKLGPRLDDIDLNLEEFTAKVNSDLVGKVVNLASRTAKFIETVGLSASYPDDDGLFQEAANASEEIAAAYENCDYNAALRTIMALADRANKFVEDNAPWGLKKDPTQARRLQDVCTVSLNLFRQIVIYLAPVLPKLAQQVGELLNNPIVHWTQAQQPLTGTSLQKFQHLMKRVEPAQVQAMLESESSAVPPTTEAPAAPIWNDGPEPVANEPLVAEHCSIDDFTKIDLRVARILEANHVPGADKLLQLTVSLGGDVKRNVFAGIKSAYKPEDLVGRLVIVCANLAPRKMRFGLSEGMILAAGAGGSEIFLLNPDSGAKPGHRVH